MSKPVRPQPPNGDSSTTASLPELLPRGPVLGWSSFKVVDKSDMASVEDLDHKAFTTSGRAAIYQALLQLNLPPDSKVLVPTYHCPTMVAPVILANLKVAYFGIRADGLPNLDYIDAVTANNCKAIIVSHYFGMASSLAEVRHWCDERDIALIEDCAHCYFGDAGERKVGAWGDFATASVSKFFPVPELGLLASAHRPIADLHLAKANLKAQLKGCVDVLELSARHEKLAGLNGALSLIFRLKNARLRPAQQADGAYGTRAENMMRDCDMTRITHAPLWASLALRSVLPRGQLIRRRQQNFAHYAQRFHNVAGAKAMFPLTAGTISQMAPYVFPLWVNDGDRIYQALRDWGLPVFRWDRIWPGTPELQGDSGPYWSRHVLQLLCHQDLHEAVVERTSQAIVSLLKTST